VKIIVSDIEGTLTMGSSWRALRRYYKENYNSLSYNQFFLRWVPRFLFVKFGLLSRKSAMIGWMLDEVRLFKNFTVEEFKRMAEWVVRTEMWPKRLSVMLSELETYRRKGNSIVLVSSAYQPIVDEFAQKLDAIGIGSPLNFREGRLDGLILPLNAYEHKAHYLQKKFPDTEILMGFGDTISDIPMLELSQNPVAVNPDEELRPIAEAKGWRVIECSLES
jgi:HAD superfamily phosphoserine phosphatase-like hydrolase